MSLKDKLADAMKTAMKSKDSVALQTIRMVRAQIKDTEIAKGKELSDEDVLGVLMAAAKKRKEAIELYEKGGRQDLLEKEKAELAVISEYLPKQLSPEEIEEVIVGVIAAVGATTAKDLGRVMGMAMKQLKGKADGKLIQDIVRAKLT